MFSFVPLTKEETAKTAPEYQHIQGLAPGDRVRWKEGRKNQKFPEIGSVITVYRVFPVEDGTVAGAQVRLLDFTALYRDTDDGELVELKHDSRNFERVTE